MSSRQLEEFQERRRDQKIAQQLSITYKELGQLSYDDLEIDESDDGVVYGMILRFHEGNPPEIMKKIEGLDGLEVILPAGLFDDPEQEPE